MKHLLLLIMIFVVALACTSATAAEFASLQAPVEKVGKSSEDLFYDMLTKSMDKTGAALEKAVDVIMEETPKIVTELLEWKFLVSLLSFIGFAIVLIPMASLVIVLGRKTYLGKASGDEIGSMILLCCLWFFVLVGAFHTNSLDWLKIKVAPRIYLIEYSADLLRKGSK